MGSATTDEPDLHLVVDGVRIEAIAVEGSRYRFELENGDRLRWTDGYGELPMTLVQPGETVDILLNVVCFAAYEQQSHAVPDHIRRAA